MTPYFLYILRLTNNDRNVCLISLIVPIVIEYFTEIVRMHVRM